MHGAKGGPARRTLISAVPRPRFWPLLAPPPGGQLPKILAPSPERAATGRPTSCRLHVVQTARYWAHDGERWGSAKVVLNPERSQHGHSRPRGPRSAASAGSPTEAPTGRPARQASRNAVPATCGQDLTCPPRKQRALPQRSCLDVTGSGSPACPDVRAPRRAAPRRGEAVPFDARRARGWELLEPGVWGTCGVRVGYVFPGRRGGREGVAAPEPCPPSHVNVTLLLFRLFRRAPFSMLVFPFLR